MEKLKLNTIYQGDCLEILKTFPDESINCVVTSPPYWGLRDYGHNGQLGLEKTPFEYIEKLKNIFSEVKRILKIDGSLWLNLGDTYSNYKDCKSVSQTLTKGTTRENAHVISKGDSHSRNSKLLKSVGLKNKELIGIPWRVAFALQESGWYLRSDIIWHKPNPMPESVKDRPTKAHEYIFLLTKNDRYYYDAESIKTPSANPDDDRGSRNNRKRFPTAKINGIRNSGMYPMANKRTVWSINTKPYSEAHFAVFPPELIVDCVKAGCPKNGIVLDPFFGSGTTGEVALRLNRKFIGIELNPEYIKIANKRLSVHLQTLFTCTE